MESPSGATVPSPVHTFRPQQRLMLRQIAVVSLLCVGVGLPIMLWVEMPLVPDALRATALLLTVSVGLCLLLHLVFTPVRVEVGDRTVTVYRRGRAPQVLPRNEIRKVSYDTRQDAIRLFRDPSAFWVADWVLRTQAFSADDTRALLGLVEPAPDAPSSHQTPSTRSPRRNGGTAAASRETG